MNDSRSVTSDRYAPDDCRWRTVLGSPGSALANCRLLSQILENHPEVDAVSRDVCEACCRSFPPSHEILNPVLASLVYNHATQLAGAEQDSHAARRWHALRKWAEPQLEIEAPALPRTLVRESTDQLPRARSLRESLPAPASRSGDCVRHWAIGVTTAPRRKSHLSECLQSLADAGWPRPHLFIDGSVSIPTQWSHLPATSHDEQLGAWPNYYLSLVELLMLEPLADAYLLVQDDAVFYCRENVRTYLQEILWPGEQPGIVSLYCASPDVQPTTGWFKYPGRWKFGAVAMVFPREIAQRMLLSPSVFFHRWSDGERSLIGIPDVIARWAEETATPIYFPSPSLVQHVGETSTIWLNEFELTPQRKAGAFVEDAIAQSHTPPAATDPRAEFPESAFQCDPEHQQEYLSRIEKGKLRMARASVVICGLCRDGESYLSATIPRIERLANMFYRTNVVLFENDSTDNTTSMLREWAAATNSVDVLSHRLNQPKFDRGTHRCRTDRMAYYRNCYLDHIRSNYSTCDFVIVVDTDLEGGWSYDGIANTFGCDNWDFVGSNGMSFRSPDAPESFEHADAFAYRAVGQLQLSAAEAHQLCFHRGEDLVPVWSCFGGLGIYRMDAFQSAAYDGHDCEHVTFHRALRERGFDRLFLNPSQIVLYSPWE